MNLFVAVSSAASAGATLGLLLGCWIGFGKRGDLEAAYTCLSDLVRQFLRTAPVGRGIIRTSISSGSLAHPRWRPDMRCVAMSSADRCPW